MIFDQSDANQEPACLTYAELEARHPELHALREHDRNRELFLKGRLTVNQFRETMGLRPIPQGDVTE